MSYQKLANSNSSNASRETHLALVKTKSPTLKHGNDDKRAKELNKLIKDAESGLCRILKVGFFLECLAADLPQGQLGPWVESHCNRKWRTVQRWKQVAAGIGDVLGISLKQRLEYKLHEVLALPLKKVPEELRAVREKLDAEISGKSYRQLFLELKQVDEDGQIKRGRAKGCKGTTKEQRATAAQAEEQARITELELTLEEMADKLDELSDDKHAGDAVSEKSRARYFEAVATAHAYNQRFTARRTTGK